MRTTEPVADWLFAVMAGLATLAGLVLILGERVKSQRGASGDVRRAVFGGLLLLLGMSGLLRKLPTLLGAPSAVVLTCDVLSLAVMLVVVVPLLRKRPRKAARTTSRTNHD
ncbi:hypothetical protein [Streptomyces sp. NPDC058295]|uniref:hypothetical protein n=1 Tax=Streptomyces sp. NPDC058295 TaxID=3346431 RepID=UPI0036EB4375